MVAGSPAWRQVLGCPAVTLAWPLGPRRGSTKVLLVSSHAVCLAANSTSRAAPRLALVWRGVCGICSPPNHSRNASASPLPIRPLLESARRLFLFQFLRIDHAPISAPPIEREVEFRQLRIDLTKRRRDRYQQQQDSG